MLASFQEQAATTIGALEALLFYVGVGKDVIEPIWGSPKEGERTMTPAL
jgi:hypothetical protein